MKHRLEFIGTESDLSVNETGSISIDRNCPKHLKPWMQLVKENWAIVWQPQLIHYQFKQTDKFEYIGPLKFGISKRNQIPTLVWYSDLSPPPPGNSEYFQHYTPLGHYSQWGIHLGVSRGLGGCFLGAFQCSFWCLSSKDPQVSKRLDWGSSSMSPQRKCPHLRLFPLLGKKQQKRKKKDVKPESLQ